jgi:mannose-P-dolichol utilization defect protein 1
MRLPVLSSGSVRGLSLSANVLETLSYGITLAYSVRNAFPFSTYGENLFLTAQNVIISVLIGFLSAKRSFAQPAILLLLFGGSAYYLNMASPSTLSLFQLATLPLSLFSKIPQIAANVRARSTGQLSSFAVFSQLLGSLARLFTTLTEVGDTRMSAGFALAFALNAVLAYQVFAYRGRASSIAVPIDIRAEQAHGSVLAEKGTGSIAWGAEAPSSKPTLPERTGSPIPRYGSPQPGRKWARKVD